MVAEVARNPLSQGQASELGQARGGDVQRFGHGPASSKPGKGSAAGSHHTKWSETPPSNPTALRPKTVAPLQLAEINKALDNLKAAKTHDEVEAAKEMLAKVVDDEMYRLSGHSRIYVARSPTDMKDAGERIVGSARNEAVREDLREAVRAARNGHTFINLMYLSGAIKDGQLKLTDTAAQEFIADAADWITAPDRGEGTNVAGLAHNQFARLHTTVLASAASPEVLAALVAQCRKEPDWTVSTESANAIRELKNLIGSGNPEANAAIKEYEAASNYLTP